jgi:hypothetical protein
MERDMYPILKKYFESLGYTVKAEVNDIDIMALKDDVVILVEMKTSLNTQLIAQGIKRRSLGDLVYLSILKPSDKVLKSNHFKDKCLILNTLELGLMLVDKKYQIVDVYMDPTHHPVRQRTKKKNALLKEFNERKTSFNIGGANKRKIITAYRELALLALYYIKDSPKSTKELRAYTQRTKVVDILQKNYYGWFKRLRRGIYGITDEGEKALETYEDIINTLKITRFQASDEFE